MSATTFYRLVTGGFAGVGIFIIWIAIHAARNPAPEPGRYQLLIQSGHLIVWDTAKARIIQYDGKTIEQLRLDFQPVPAK